MHHHMEIPLRTSAQPSHARTALQQPHVDCAPQLIVEADLAAARASEYYSTPTERDGPLSTEQQQTATKADTATQTK